GSKRDPAWLGVLLLAARSAPATVAGCGAGTPTPTDRAEGRTDGVAGLPDRASSVPLRSRVVLSAGIVPDATVVAGATVVPGATVMALVAHAQHQVLWVVAEALAEQVETAHVVGV